MRNDHHQTNLIRERVTESKRILSPSHPYWQGGGEWKSQKKWKFPVCSNTLSNDIFLGDGHTVISPMNHSSCQKCVGLKPTQSSATPLTEMTSVLAEIPCLLGRKQRSPSDVPEYTQLYDGKLDTTCNYTGFVEVIGKFNCHMIFTLIDSQTLDVVCIYYRSAKELSIINFSVNVTH